MNIGDKIRIIEMKGEPQMTGKEGIVEDIFTDPWGDERVEGTWGIALYPKCDKYEIIKE